MCVQYENECPSTANFFDTVTSGPMAKFVDIFAAQPTTFSRNTSGNTAEGLSVRPDGA